MPLRKCIFQQPPKRTLLAFCHSCSPFQAPGSFITVMVNCTFCSLLLFWLPRLKQSPFPFEQRVHTNAHGKAFKRIRSNNRHHIWRQQQGQQHFFAPIEIQHDKKDKPTNILVAPLPWCFNAKNERAGHQKARPPPKKTANVVPGQQQTKCIHHHMCTSSDYPFTIQRHHKCGRLNRNNSIKR